MNKYEASKEFAKGFRFAVCRSNEAANFDSVIFMAGYQYGKKIKDAYIAALNETLQENGFEPMGIMTIQ